jgi:TonB family protein
MFLTPVQSTDRHEGESCRRLWHRDAAIMARYGDWRRPSRFVYIAGMRTPIGCLVATALATLLSAGLLAQAPAEKPAGSEPDVRIATDTLVAPLLKNGKDINKDYPFSEILERGEGWVLVDMMIDTNGKPFEVTVNSSSGNKVFEAAAVKAAEHATFEPGRLNGSPTEAATAIKFTYAQPSASTGARPEFASAYRSFMKAIRAKDRSAADAAMKSMDARNLYENAYLGLAQYEYAVNWGNEAEQLKGLNRAIADESRAHYLPETQFKTALTACVALYVNSRNYAAAMSSWKTLQKAGVDPGVAEKLAPAIRAIEQIKNSNLAYDIDRSMPDGTWFLNLFKRHFRIKVIEGHVFDVKLRCQKGFVRFALDPQLEYTVADRYGDCNIELDGEPGTRFTLTQF